MKKGNAKTTNNEAANKPDFAEQEWLGSNFVKLAVWNEETTLENGSQVLDHKCKLVSGYRTKSGSYKENAIWVPGNLLLRLAKIVDEADTHVSENKRKYRKAKRAA